MLFKQLIGSLILLLNMAGAGFLIYATVRMLKDRFFPGEKAMDMQPAPDRAIKKEAAIINDDIIPDEEDLLKDMDLSDLDNLDLDDFK